MASRMRSELGRTLARTWSLSPSDCGEFGKTINPFGSLDSEILSRGVDGIWEVWWNGRTDMPGASDDRNPTQLYINIPTN